VRVLIVEDEWLIALAAEQALQEAQFDVVATCSSVQQALAAVRSSPPEIALLDTNLRGESSEAVALELRARGIPFLVISGYTAEQLDGPLAGAPFLGKPFPPSALVQALRRICA
jgi:DNA-binding response OmpR family regulator